MANLVLKNFSTVQCFKPFIFLLLICFALPSFGQSRIDTLLTKLETLPNNIEKVDVYLNLAREYESIDITSAFSFLDKMESLSRKKEYHKGVRSAIREKAILFYNQGKFIPAITTYKSIFEERLLDDQIDSADIFNLLGISYQGLGLVDSSLIFLNKSLEIYDRIDSDKGRITAFTNIGNSFYESGNDKQALYYNEKAYALAKRGNNKEHLFKSTLNYAMFVLLVNDDIEKVDSLLIVAFNSPYLENDPDMQSAYYQNIATFYYSLGKLDRAEQLYQKSLLVINASGYQPSPGIHMGLGQINFKREQYDNAIFHFKKGLSLSKKRSDLLMVCENLAKTYTVLNVSDSAIFYWNKHIEILRELEGERIQNLLLKSKTNVDIVIKEGQIKLLEEEAKIKSLNNIVKRNTIIGLVIIMLFLIIITLMLLRKKRREIELKETNLKIKNQKLVSLSLQINQKNQALHDFEESLLKDESSVIHPTLLNSLKRNLKKSLQIDRDWENFEIFFNDLHEGFYDKLKDRFPNLTNGELKICSLVKLRFNMKEIAQTLVLSVDSVKSARYRVRKKLNIPTETDLSDFLNSL